MAEAQQFATSCLEGHQCPETIAIAFRTLCRELYPVILYWALVMQEARWPRVLDKQNVDLAVVIKVAKCHTPPNQKLSESRP